MSVIHAGFFFQQKALYIDIIMSNLYFSFFVFNVFDITSLVLIVVSTLSLNFFSSFL